MFFGMLCNSPDLSNGGVKGQCDASCGLCAYALGPGTCETCGVGQYQPSADMMLFCTACPAGKFQDTAGQAACQECPPGRTQRTEGTGATTALLACDSCAVGRYSTASGATVCSACPAGRKSNGATAAATESAACDDCQPGYYRSATHSVGSCVAAAPGQAVPLAAAQAVTLCNASLGEYQNGHSATSCLTCGAGTTAKLNSFGLSTSCELCPAGRQGTDGKTCTPCAAGRYKITPTTAAEGAAACTEAPMGGYTASVGAVAPEPCAAGMSTSFNRGQTSCTACLAGYQASRHVSGSTGLPGAPLLDLTNTSGLHSPTDLGMDGPSPGGKIALATAANSVESYWVTAWTALGHGPEKGGFGCRQCPAGSYGVLSTSATPTGECVACARGRHAAKGAAEATNTITINSGGGTLSVKGCSICGDGTTPSPNQDACVPCAAGRYSNPGQTAGLCDSCASPSAGKYTDGTTIPAQTPGTSTAGAAGCTTCTPGKIPISNACSSCAAGQFSTAGVCVACTAGRYSDGTAACNTCGHGQEPNATKTACVPCPAGKARVQFATLSSSEQTRMSTRPENSDTCADCAAGFYAPSAGLQECAAVAKGYEAPATGASAQTACAAGLYQPTDPALFSAAQLQAAMKEAVCRGCEIGFEPAVGRDECTACGLGTASSWRDTICGKVGGTPAWPTDPSAAAWPDVATASNVGLKQLARVCCPLTLCGSGVGCSESAATISCRPSEIMAAYLGGIGQTAPTVPSCNTNGGSSPCVIGHRTDPAVSPTSVQLAAAAATMAHTCTACQPGFYMEFQAPDFKAGKWCKPASAGFYVPNASASSPLPCPPGQVTALTGQSQCQFCAAGTEPATGNATCTPCQPGHARAATDASGCVACQAGFYANGTGSAACDAAPPGTFVAGPGASSYTHCNTGRPYDDSLLTNEFQPAANASACVECPANHRPQLGRFSPEAPLAAVQCEPCPPGRHGNGVNQKVPLGYLTTYSSILPLPLSSYRTACVDCEVGKFQSAAGAAQCVDATPGSYVAARAAAFPTLCETGSVQPASGQSGCTTCRELFPTTFKVPDQPKGAIECVHCAAGRYGTYVHNHTNTSQFNQTHCVDCQPGFYQPLVGQASCVAAAPGFYVGPTAVGTARTASKPCPAGMITNRSGSASCEVCPAGRAPDGARTECLVCAKGSARPLGSTTGRCEACPPGQYAESDGQGRCDMCSPGGSTEARAAVNYSAAVNATILVNATYVNGTMVSPAVISPGRPEVPAQPGYAAQTTCFRCPVGQSGNGLSCTSCTVGKYNPTAGRAT